MVAPLTSVVEVVVPHENGLVFVADSGFQDLSHKQGMVSVRYLPHNLALPPGGRIQQQRATGFRSVFEGFSPYGARLSLVALEKVEGGI